jgi:hypothetical protein
MTAWMVSPTVAIHRIRGVYSVAISEFVCKFFDNVFLIAKAPIHIFGDFSEIASYESEMREIMTHYTHLHRDLIADLNYLISNKKLAMGITVFGLGVTGTPVHSYLSTDAFEEAIRRVIN